MNESIYRPLSTGEIPMPVLEEGERGTPAEEVLPRILRQAGGSDRAGRNVLLLALLFILVSLLELGLFLRMPAPESIVVYGETPRSPLLEKRP